MITHEGIPVEHLGPDPNATLELPNGTTLRAGQPIVTYVARNLEPHRGFHQFMRALPIILRKHSSCQVVIVGGDSVSYGKSTLRAALKIFQSIGRGVNRIGQLVKSEDFTLGRATVPMRFELEVELDNKLFSYALALELPERFRELRILEEELKVNGSHLFSRKGALVTVHRDLPHRNEAQFNMDWHLVALPVIQDPATADALGTFRDWLASMVLLVPIPKLMSGNAEGGTHEPAEDGANWADWLSGLLDRYPAAYATIIGGICE